MNHLSWKYLISDEKWLKEMISADKCLKPNSTKKCSSRRISEKIICDEQCSKEFVDDKKISKIITPHICPKNSFPQKNAKSKEFIIWNIENVSFLPENTMKKASNI